ncbi:MAG TPA: hypothetical protein VKG23_13080, partial [Thermoanaerobaculia bacterium]|nr:hypothetical protein [Thermoanaerobaculia bacterium]
MIVTSPDRREPASGSGELSIDRSPEIALSLDEDGVAAVRAELEEIRREICEEEQRQGDPSVRVHPAWVASARNLLHYLTLRQRDLRSLQRKLAVLGLSSLGRSESHVLASVDAVIAAIDRLGHQGPV